MHIIEPHQLTYRHKKNHRLARFVVWMLVLALLLAAGYAGYFRYTHNLVVIKPTRTTDITIPASASALAWPTYGQGAVGTAGYGVLSSHNTDHPQPTASVAKIMTALAVLDRYPLKVGEPGPTLTMTANDVALYNQYVAKDGSVVLVAAGEQITEYQALQALLLPSANNMADTLALWAFGSMQNYEVYANNFAKTLHMENTLISDASGYSPQTVSTASDLVLLGAKALQNPVLAEIVAQPQANLPVAGITRNVNSLLGRDGINGIKTGDTDAAGGCYLVSSIQQLSTGQRVTVIAAIMGAPTLQRAQADMLPLLSTTLKGFSESTVASAGQIVGYYHLPWGGTVTAIASSDSRLLVWRGETIHPTLKLRNLTAPAPANTVVGQITLNFGSTSVSGDAVLETSVTPPSTLWRLKHILSRTTLY